MRFNAFGWVAIGVSKNSFTVEEQSDYVAGTAPHFLLWLFSWELVAGLNFGNKTKDINTAVYTV